MAAANHNEEVIKWLELRGHTQEEIAKIQAKLTAYDEKAVRDALFDAAAALRHKLYPVITPIPNRRPLAAE